MQKFAKDLPVVVGAVSVGPFVDDDRRAVTDLHGHLHNLFRGTNMPFDFQTERISHSGKILRISEYIHYENDSAKDEDGRLP